VEAGASTVPKICAAPDEQHEQRLLVGGQLHRRVDAEEAVRVAKPGARFRAAAPTSPG